MTKKLTLLTILCFAAILRADPPDQAWQACDAMTPCPDQMQCVKFYDMETPVCWPADTDPCLYCGEADCSIMESYPPQVRCSDDTPDVDPVTCVTSFDCPERYECVEGYCEPTEGPVETETTACKNEAGYCEIGDTSGFCECITGEGIGWAEAPEPAEPTDPVEPGEDGGSDGDETVPPQPYFLPTQDECMAKLVEICGEKAPDLNEECGEELFDACLGAVEWVEGTCFETTLTEEERAAIAKGEWVGDWSMMVYQCCTQTTIDTLEDDLDELKECIETDGCDECLGDSEDPAPLTPCVEDADCPDGGHCADGTCYWSTEEGGETTTNPADDIKDDSGDTQTGGEDYANTDGTGNEATAPRTESAAAACALILI